jgi:hypothetical protein
MARAIALTRPRAETRNCSTNNPLALARGDGRREVAWPGQSLQVLEGDAFGKTLVDEAKLLAETLTALG